MIIDSHTHAWEKYEHPMFDYESRGRIEQLLFHMDRNGVDKAVLVCARVYENDRNNDYVYECVQQYPNRIVQFADVDCSWSNTYHVPGAAKRLEDATKRFGLKGYTHYLKDDYDWFESPEGSAFFEKTAELRLIASLALGTGWQPALRKLAARFPSIPFLCHHMANATPREAPPYPNMNEVLKSAELPNIHIKLSGFHYQGHTAWDFPYSDTHWVVRKLYEHYGPERLCWGSDYPEVRNKMTYTQTLEVVRTHLPFVPETHKKLILGENMERLLVAAG
ncbi:MAG: amidohydrolase [candidate division Zixibacteria bacterium]|nr:amidohydrolase [candidate division Zixibacteria bacterium]